MVEGSTRQAPSEDGFVGEEEEYGELELSGEIEEDACESGLLSGGGCGGMVMCVLVGWRVDDGWMWSRGWGGC